MDNSIVTSNSATTGSILKFLEQSMLELVGPYDDPSTIPEWDWVREHASFAHVGNDKEDGVYEFFVNVEKLQSASDAFEAVPPALRSAVEQAAAEGCIWLLFHQG